MIRVVVLHVDTLHCNHIVAALQESVDIEVIGAVTSSAAALAAIETGACDVVVVSASLPQAELLRLVHFVASEGYMAKMLLTDLIHSPELILDYLEEGVNGYVLVDEPLTNLIEKIRALHQDLFPVPPTIVPYLLKRLKQLKKLLAGEEVDQHQTRSGRVISLSKREREVLQLLGRGYNNQEIARELVIEVGTAKYHVHKVFRKLGIQKREDARYLAPK